MIKYKTNCNCNLNEFHNWNNTGRKLTELVGPLVAYYDISFHVHNIANAKSLAVSASYDKLSKCQAAATYNAAWSWAPAECNVPGGTKPL